MSYKQYVSVNTNITVTYGGGHSMNGLPVGWQLQAPSPSHTVGALPEAGGPGSAWFLWTDILSFFVECLLLCQVQHAGHALSLHVFNSWV